MSAELRERPLQRTVTGVLPLRIGVGSPGADGAGGLATPGDPSPPRQPNSVRRTSTIDISVDATGSAITLRGSGRDLATDRDLQPRLIATARTEVGIDVETRTITSVWAPPHPHARVNALVGLPAGSGFRRAFRGELAGLAGEGSLLGLLLDEVPVTMVIAGSILRRRPNTAAQARRLNPPLDVCAGWARGGLLATTTLAEGGPPLSQGPLVPPIDATPDEHAWHRLAALPAWSMRRARRLDVTARSGGVGGYEIDAFFRDSRMSADGLERGVHEYSLRASVDAAGTVVEMNAVPHVLPAPECPAAAASAQRLIGSPLRQLREQVSREFTGTSTCTHLNDALRALGDLGSLIDLQAVNEGTRRG